MSNENKSNYEATHADVEKWIAAWNTHESDKIAALFADDVTMFQPQNPKPLTKTAMLGYFEMLFKSYADINFKSNGATIQNNEIASWETITGTMTGEFHDPATGKIIAPTNKSFSVEGAMHIVYNDVGLIKSVRIYWDRMDMYAQVGLLNQ